MAVLAGRSLTSNKIGDEGTKELGEALTKNSTLTNLGCVGEADGEQAVAFGLWHVLLSTCVYDGFGGCADWRATKLGTPEQVHSVLR